MNMEYFYTVKGQILSGSADHEDVVDWMNVIEKVFEMVDEASCEDFYGTEGYKHALGWDE